MEDARNNSLRVARVGLIGDVHTEAEALKTVLAYFSGVALDAILCTGDLPDGPLDAASVEACCRLLAEHAVVTISGNHDRWLQDDEMRDLPDATDPGEVSPATLSKLAALPQTVELETPAGHALLCHGIGSDDMNGIQPFDHGLALEKNAALAELVKEGRYRIILNGHTHRPMVRAVGALTIINAGTLLRGQGPCCAIVDFEQRVVRFFNVTSGSVTQAGEPIPF